jgi:hypothetical protein
MCNINVIDPSVTKKHLCAECNLRFNWKEFRAHQYVIPILYCYRFYLFIVICIATNRRDVHAQDRVFSCNHCDRTFKSKSDRNTHKLVHDENASEVKRVHCTHDGCTKHFSSVCHYFPSFTLFLQMLRSSVFHPLLNE